MLMSMMSAPLSTLYLAASAIIPGSAPAIWITLGSTSPSWLPRRMVFSDPHRSELDATISETAIPAPSRLQRLRKGRSVTPAMGATIRLFFSWMGPIFKVVSRISVSATQPAGDGGKVLILYASQIASEAKSRAHRFSCREFSTAVKQQELRRFPDEAKRRNGFVESF